MVVHTVANGMVSGAVVIQLYSIHHMVMEALSRLVGRGKVEIV